MIKNAKITGTSLGNDDRGPSFWIHLDYGGSGQGFGGYMLGGQFTNYVVLGILDTLEVDKWEDLKGKSVRVETDSDNDYGGTIKKLGHYLKDQWFDPAAMPAEGYKVK